MWQSVSCPVLWVWEYWGRQGPQREWSWFSTMEPTRPLITEKKTTHSKSWYTQRVGLCWARAKHWPVDKKPVDYKKNVPVCVFQEQTSGKGVNVIVDMLSNVNLSKDLQMLASGGRVVVSHTLEHFSRFSSLMKSYMLWKCIAAWNLVFIFNAALIKVSRKIFFCLIFFSKANLLKTKA